MDLSRTRELFERPGAVTSVGRVLVASGDGLLFDDEIEAVDAAGDVVTWSPLPELGRWYRARSGAVRTVLAVVDQTGGELHQLVLLPDEGGREVDHDTVQGDAAETVHKPREGGNAHKQHQRRHEQASYQNAEEIVAAIRSAASSLRPQLIALAGEVQGRQAVRSQLPEELAEITQELEHGSRADGSSEAAMDDELLRLAGRAATAEQAAVREQLREGKAHATAVEGLKPVLQAARTGAVQTLVLVANGEVPGELYVGSSPEQISTEPPNLASMSGTTPVARPSEQVLIRTVGALGGSVSVLGAGAQLQDHVGALLRFGFA